MGRAVPGVGAGVFTVGVLVKVGENVVGLVGDLVVGFEVLITGKQIAGNLAGSHTPQFFVVPVYCLTVAHQNLP